MLKVHTTADGSKTLYRPDLQESYHSEHGALSESAYVFVAQGLDFRAKESAEIRLLEVGFGTGLNALLSLKYALENPEVQIEYVGLEPFPPPPDLLDELAYDTLCGAFSAQHYKAFHTVSWGEKHRFAPNFSFCKLSCRLEDFKTKTRGFDVIYFDAFAPRKQADMWSLNQVGRCASLLKTGGILVTYCAMGQFRRDLRAAGFEVVKLPGPPGKREMTRAIKMGHIEQKQ